MIKDVTSVLSFEGQSFAIRRDDFVVRVPPLIGNRESLLSTLAEGLGFPNYFGNNWDSFSECLRDLSWIHLKRVVILHSDLPPLDKAAQSTYLEILAECVKDWQRGENHELIAVFPPECYVQIQNMHLISPSIS
jgi:hypothetical protein